MALTEIPVELSSTPGIADSSNATAITIDSSENVGINDASPFAKLHVEDTSWSSGSPYGTVAYIQGGATNDLNWGHLLISQSGTTTDTGGRLSFGANGENPIAGIRAKYKGATYGDLAFLTRPSGGTNTERMVIDSAGHVTMPNQPAFRVKPTSDQSNFAIDSWVDVAMGTEAFDVGSNFASNTFTAPVTGKYQLNLQLRLNGIDSAANFYQARINTSNQIFYHTIDPDFGQDAAYWTFILSIFTDMDASDTATIGIYQSLGTSQTDVSNDSHFSGYLVA